ncbi:sporulation histidine kinase inhibitor Sda [Priestia megaterium]|nr:MULTISPECIES: sporulation histidine kinase inhibitor Sda [Priestia]AYE51811.1 sporulation histidine kinase inhibitor Sda [Priestia megaterium NCT-2]MCU7712413.1 sporulation histidine kinase inhibitor Sda [Priestia megaterium]MCW1045148.1 sporulation histidine kinase inhibitor Sda [Priestia sp. JV24]MDH3187692.1 sporulation histidine kinase inhibitor Sda [Priestia megaterium]UMZ34809.1 sporulation histidine kinase inhibitor Sda [Priestia megaterium]
MEKLNDETLLASYFKAIELKLDQDFILILEEELKRRDLPFITKTDRSK